MRAFVNDQAPVELTVRFYNLYRPDSVLIRGQVKSTEITKGAANDLEAKRLLVRAGDEVYRIRRIRHRKGRNFLVEDATLPAALVPGLADATTIADDVSLLAEQYGILLGKAEERISMATAPPAIADILAIAPGTLVLLLDRIVHMLDEPRPVEWRIATATFPAVTALK